MAHIENRKGKFRVSLCIDRNRKSKTFATLEAAKEWADLMEIQERFVTVEASQENDLSLLQDGIVEASTIYIKKGGIYFLISCSKIIYIGKSKNLLVRIGNHAQNGVKFSRYFLIEADEPEASRLEQHYIKKFNPPLNIRLTGNGNKPVSDAMIYFDEKVNSATRKKAIQARMKKEAIRATSTLQASKVEGR